MNKYEVVYYGWLNSESGTAIIKGSVEADGFYIDHNGAIFYININSNTGIEQQVVFAVSEYVSILKLNEGS